MTVSPHNHSVDDLPVGVGPGKIPLSSMVPSMVPSLVWDLGVPWSTIEAQLAGGAGVVVVVADPDPAVTRLMTRSVTSVDGTTDLSKIVFIGVTPGTDTYPPVGPVLVEWDGTPGAEFQLGAGGGLQSQNILWQYRMGIGAVATGLDHIDWVLDGGGIQPLADTWLVRIGKPGHYSRLTLRNGAQIGGGALVAEYVFMIVHMAPPLPVKPVLEFTATTGAVIGPHSFYSDVVHLPNPIPPHVPFNYPYSVPSTIDASVQYDATAHSPWSARASTNLDQAYQTSFDPAVGGGVLVSTDVQGAVDELTGLATYTAANPANWNGTAPTSIADALDRIAAMLGPIT